MNSPLFEFEGSKLYNDHFCAVYADIGTTNSRIWLLRGKTVLAHAAASIGIRDSAKDGHRSVLWGTLRELILEVRRSAVKAGPENIPSCLIAAGMITSGHGLAEVPHIKTPAGIRELAAGIRRFSVSEVTDLPILLIPGIRSGADRQKDDVPDEMLEKTDVMRGEETLCMGLQLTGLLSPPATVLNLGSHWKAIEIDSEGRIAGSITSLSGELIHVTQTNTILASSLPQERSESIDFSWCDAGMRVQRRSGLSRALFCVRLLDINNQTTPEERMSFLFGAFISADLDALQSRRVLGMNGKVLIVGGKALADGWLYALRRESVEALKIEDKDSQEALHLSMHAIALAAGVEDPNVINQ